MPMRGETALIVDHHPRRCQELEELLASLGMESITAASCEDALAILAEAPLPLIFADTDLPDKSGYFLLREVAERDPDCMVVLLADNTSDIGLLQALHQGAFDFIMRPLDAGDILLPTLNRARRHLKVLREKAEITRRLENKTVVLTKAVELMRSHVSAMEKLSSLATISELLATLLESAATVVGARCGFIALIEREHGSISIWVARGYEEDFADCLATEIPPGVIREIIREAEPVLIADTFPAELDQLLSSLERNRLFPHPGLIAVPLFLRQQEAGLVVMCGHPPNHPFNRYGLDFLQQLCRHTALLLENIGLQSQLQKSSNNR